MCTLKELKETIWEECHSQRDMETTEIDRVFSDPAVFSGKQLV